MRKKRGNSRYFFIFFTLLFLLYMLYYSVLKVRTSISWFNVTTIRFSGTEKIKLDSLQAAVTDFYNVNMYTIEDSLIKEKLGNFNRIKSIDIQRIIPSTININIEERIPVFKILTTDGKLFPVDIEKVCLIDDNPDYWENLPVISIEHPADSVQANQIVNSELLTIFVVAYPDIIAHNPDFFNFVSQIFMDNGDVLLVDHLQGYYILLDPDNLLENIINYIEIENTCSFEKQSIIDMTTDGNYRVYKKDI